MMTGKEIARRASNLIGAPFRLHGRDGLYGVDCVGLVAEAANLNAVPRDYMLRGDYATLIHAVLDFSGFHQPSGPLSDGDIILLRCGPRQLHLAIIDGDGAVHAHAGLGRVVWTPNPLPWPQIGRWRISGD